MRTLDDLLRAGKVRHVGLSDTPAWYASRAQAIAELRGYEPISALQLEYSLVERNIEREFVDFGRETGAGIMVWSPLASGFLSGKYKPGQAGEGRLELLKNSGNPGFQKFTPRNWAILAELEKVAAEVQRPMAQVALNWVANRPGVASEIVGATKLHQLEDNIRALAFELPPSLRARLDQISEPEPQFPYTFFGQAIQGMIHGAAAGDKPDGYRAPIRIAAGGAGVE